MNLPVNVRFYLLLAGSEYSEILIGEQAQSLWDVPGIDLGLDRLSPRVVSLRSELAGKFKLTRPTASLHLFSRQCLCLFFLGIHIIRSSKKLRDARGPGS